MLTYRELESFLQKHDRTSYYGLRTVQTMQGDKTVAPIAKEILDFINHRFRGDALAAYTKRVEDLRCLQKEFERTGKYSAGSCSEIRNVDDESYKLSLLLSFICTNHRFEILKELKRFLGEPSNGTRRLLSIGYGTGYELKIAREALPNWTIEGFDNAEDSFSYAQDLLAFFQGSGVTLRKETFPLNATELGQGDHGTFAKIVACELLEHLENPAEALTNLRERLAGNGRIFLTMAINIAQEDHVFLYSSPMEARDQALACGYRIVREVLAPAVALPFNEANRAKVFRKGNYICVAEKA